MEANELQCALEAVLFAAGEPVAVAKLCQVLEVPEQVLHAHAHSRHAVRTDARPPQDLVLPRHGDISDAFVLKHDEILRIVTDVAQDDAVSKSGRDSALPEKLAERKMARQQRQTERIPPPGRFTSQMEEERGYEGVLIRLGMERGGEQMNGLQFRPGLRFLRNERALPLNRQDQPRSHKPADRLAHGQPRNAVSGRQLLLGRKFVARPQHPLPDLKGQLRLNLFVLRL